MLELIKVPHLDSGFFPANSFINCFFDMSKCISTAQARTNSDARRVFLLENACIKRLL